MDKIMAVCFMTFNFFADIPKYGRVLPLLDKQQLLKLILNNTNNEESDLQFKMMY